METRLRRVLGPNFGVMGSGKFCQACEALRGKRAYAAAQRGIMSVAKL